MFLRRFWNEWSHRNESEQQQIQQQSSIVRGKSGLELKRKYTVQSVASVEFITSTGIDQQKSTGKCLFYDFLTTTTTKRMVWVQKNEVVYKKSVDKKKQELVGDKLLVLLLPQKDEDNNNKGQKANSQQNKTSSP